MHLILDAREYDALQPLDPHRYGASEPLAMRIASSLARRGHRVDAVWKGTEEHLVDNVMWWPWNRHPVTCDVLISCEWLVHADEFKYERLLVPLNKINPILNSKEDRVNAFVVFSEEHKRQLLFYTPTIKPEQVAIIAPRVEMPA